MLISLLLTLSPESSAVLLPEVGRAVLAAAMARLGQVDSALVEQIHAGNGPLPLTCSSLVAVERTTTAGLGDKPRRLADGVQVRPDAHYWVRVTGLTEAVSQALLDGLVERAPALWILQDHVFRVLEITCDGARNPWSGKTSCESLAAESLRQAEHLPRSLTLEFASPTAFKSLEMQVPVPLPGLVFGSLVERWNAFSSMSLDPDLRRFAEERVVISRYWLESRPVPGKNSALHVGGVGRVTYTALDDDRYAVTALNMLADFALYSGVGVQASTGMGQCRRLR